MEWPCNLFLLPWKDYLLYSFPQIRATFQFLLFSCATGNSESDPQTRRSLTSQYLLTIGTFLLMSGAHESPWEKIHSSFQFSKASPCVDIGYEKITLTIFQYSFCTASKFDPSRRPNRKTVKVWNSKKQC